MKKSKLFIVLVGIVCIAYVIAHYKLGWIYSGTAIAGGFVGAILLRFIQNKTKPSILDDVRLMIENMTHEERLQYIDGLDGRSNIEDQTDQAEVLDEALLQAKRCFAKIVNLYKVKE